MDIPSLVSTEWLAAHLDDSNLRVADVRWYLFEKERTGKQEYLKGHIPGAVFLDVDVDLAAPVGQGPGRHPLPRAEAFAESVSRAGISATTHVIAYDDRGGATAARLWWLLRYFGHDGVSLLDGGITRWTAEGRPLQAHIPTPARAAFVARPRADWVVDRETVDASRQDRTAVILDSRVPERYEGKVEPIDPKPGHIPGAVNAPLAGNLRAPEDPRFLDPPALRKRFEELGAGRGGRVIAYCGSGVNACQNIFAMELAGFENTLLYEGSWSDWSRQPGAPVAVGDRP
jgi:thiosulfate/3-mercaptopyruvate sulfurtransferase